jgi:hypothetical protein
MRNDPLVTVLRSGTVKPSRVSDAEAGSAGSNFYKGQPMTRGKKHGEVRNGWVWNGTVWYKR